MIKKLDTECSEDCAEAKRESFSQNSEQTTPNKTKSTFTIELLLPIVGVLIPLILFLFHQL